MSNRIYPIPIKPASKIVNWDGWPDDVRNLLHEWNSGHLSFVRSYNVFKCVDCETFCKPHMYGAAVLDGAWLCDDCLIERARKALDK